MLRQTIEFEHRTVIQKWDFMTPGMSGNRRATSDMMKTVALQVTPSPMRTRPGASKRAWPSTTVQPAMPRSLRSTQLRESATTASARALTLSCLRALTFEEHAEVQATASEMCNVALATSVSWAFSPC